MFPELTVTAPIRSRKMASPINLSKSGSLRLDGDAAFRLHVKVGDEVLIATDAPKKRFFIARCPEETETDFTGYSLKAPQSKKSRSVYVQNKGLIDSQGMLPGNYIFGEEEEVKGINWIEMLLA